ncbi:MAG: alpha/beta hydrolase [Chloroflexota bacterium]|nr:alpha/beta hydrolase [Chloroflexota bacterium]
MAEIKHRTMKTNGINMHIAEAGSGPLVLMLHGFPESWYSWRHQIPALADAGYHAVASDIRGYGGTDKPQEIEAYAMKTLVDDAVGVLDALGEQTAVVVGHNWGAPMAWQSALTNPDRFRAVVGMSVPYTGRPPMAPTKLFEMAFPNNFFYIRYFQEPGVAEAELEADVRRSLRLVLCIAFGDARTDAGLMSKPRDATFLQGLVEPERLPSWLTEADIDYYTGEFQRSGFRGPLNRYRSMDRDWEHSPELEGAKVQQPTLFIAGELDPVIRNPSAIETMKQNITNLRDVVLLPGAGHWTQQERPKEVNAALIDFLKGR